MTETKYSKYIVTELKQNIDEASWAGKSGGRILYLDNEVVPGAFYAEVAYGGPPDNKETSWIPVEPHKHDYDEVLGFIGTDFHDPYALNAEVEFWLGDEKHILTKSCIIFIPRGLMHCPLIYRKKTKPIFVFATHHGNMYK